MKLDSKKIFTFLRALTDTEYTLLDHLLYMRQLVHSCLDIGGTKDEIVRRAGIKPTEYTKFISGGFDYNLFHMTAIETYLKELQKVKLETKEYIKIGPMVENKGGSK